MCPYFSTHKLNLYSGSNFMEGNLKFFPYFPPNLCLNYHIVRAMVYSHRWHLEYLIIPYSAKHLFLLINHGLFPWLQEQLEMDILQAIRKLIVGMHAISANIDSDALDTGHSNDSDSIENTSLSGMSKKQFPDVLFSFYVEIVIVWLFQFTWLIQDIVTVYKYRTLTEEANYPCP